MSLHVMMWYNLSRDAWRRVTEGQIRGLDNGFATAQVKKKKTPYTYKE